MSGRAWRPHIELSKVPLSRGLRLKESGKGGDAMARNTRKASRIMFRSIAAMTLFAAVTSPLRLLGQERKAVPHHYMLMDLGTFGGPGGFFPESQPVLNQRGTLVGWTDTSKPDPYSPNCQDPQCLVQHGFEWRNGVLTDLGALPGVNNSQAQAINNEDLVVGLSQTGAIDPLTGFPVQHAVVWRNGEIADIGTLGGTQAAAFTVNDRGQAAGYAENAISDNFSGVLFGPAFTTQIRAFRWDAGAIHDLGTLGGTIAFGQAMNQLGEVAGFSTINSVPNPSTGLPTIDPFLWDDGGMIDLGGFGGTFGQVFWLNNQGQVAGDSNLPGDQTFHAFRWGRGTLSDLGTFGGSLSHAAWINDDGDVVGGAQYGDGLTVHAALWRDKSIQDLGTVAGDRCSGANSINSIGQIVGVSWAEEGFCFTPSPAVTAQHAVLWEASSLFDLNSEIPAGSGLQLVTAININDRGEIAGIGLPPGIPISQWETAGHVFVPIPCDENHPDIIGCDYSLAEPIAAPDVHPAQSSQAPISPETQTMLFRAEMMARYRHLMASANRRFRALPRP